MDLSLNPLIKEWPGKFPLRENSTNDITFNLKSDGYPTETTWAFYKLANATHWDLVDYGNPFGLLEPNNLYSYNQTIEEGVIYTLQIYDSFGDGLLGSFFGLLMWLLLDVCCLESETM